MSTQSKPDPMEALAASEAELQKSAHSFAEMWGKNQGGHPAEYWLKLNQDRSVRLQKAAIAYSKTVETAFNLKP